MSTIRLDQDDALGGGNDEYNDAQGVFDGVQAPFPGTVEPGTSGGGGAAKILLLGFSLVLVGCLGWLSWKFAHRGGAQVEETLPAALADQNAIPMTGAPGQEEAPLAPQMSPAGMPSGDRNNNLQASSSNSGVETVASASLAPAVAPMSLGAPVPAAGAPSAEATPSAMTAAQPEVGPKTIGTAPAASGDAEAWGRLEAELQQRIDTLERKVEVLQRIGPAPQRRSAAAAPTRHEKPPAGKPAVTAPKVVPTAPSGLVLKAVLEGRAWLQLPSGETITAAPGDPVAGVGTVSVIDAERGEVRFSNGVVLR